MGNSGKAETSIQGTLLMMDDVTPHVAVVVQAVRDGKVIATTLSDERGRYQLVNLKRGQYEVRCYTLNGYVYHDDILKFEGGKTIAGVDFRFAPFKKGTWRNYTYLDGLAHNNVYDIYQDPDGLMWFATTRGVSRYDGKTFTHLTTEDGLAQNFVYKIHRDPDGVMWFATDGGGVSRYDGEEFTNLTTKDGLSNRLLYTIAQGPDGMMWFGGPEGGADRYDGKEFVNFTIEDGLPENRAKAIHCDPDGVVWFGTNAGVSRFDGKEFVNFTTEDGLANNRISRKAIYRDPDGVMWFGTEGGVSRYDGKKFVNLTTEDGLLHNIVYAICRDPDGVMWFGTEGGVSRYDGKGFVNFTTEDGLASNVVHAIHQDPDGVLWFGTVNPNLTEGGGISRYDPRGFINLTTEDGLASNNVRSIYRDPDGVMWLGTGDGVSRYDPTGMGNSPHFINFTMEDGLVDNSINSIHRDPNGVLWFATGNMTYNRGGISQYDPRGMGDCPHFVNFTAKHRLTHRHSLVRVIYCDPDGVIWFATGAWVIGDGIFRYDGKEFIKFTVEDGLAHNLVNGIYRDPDGIMWFATGGGAFPEGGGGVSRYDGRGFTNITTEDGLIHNAVRSIYRDPDGIMWFGTEGGVSRYDGRKFISFTMEDGLPSNQVEAIYRDSDGVMWFAAGLGGVSGYDGTAWTSLDTRDGLAGNRVASILQELDGSLLFATSGGIARYRRSTTPPRAFIVSVTTDRTYTNLSAIPAFTPGTRITVEYSSVDLKTLPEKRQYRCRIGEIDQDWRKPTKDTSTDFVFNEPGTYTVEVQAIDRDLNYSEPASLKLEVIPDPRNGQIAQLKSELAERERAEMERMQRELEDARQIQRSLLPTKAPEVQGFEIAGVSHPAKEVSGDFYSYLSLGDNTGIVLADVTGKSVKAAMVAALADGMLNEATKSRKDLWNSPGLILKELNIGLHPRLMRSMFTAMSLSIIRPEQKQIVLSNAGMPYPVVKRRDEVWELGVNGIPLGLMDSAEYEDLSIDLEASDFVIFCSDGVIEAENETGEMYQTERLLESIHQANPGLSAQEMVSLVVKDVTAFMGDEEASDDITIVVLRYEG